jgi:glycosyltransferase involved in cell wall biosynthesis
VVAVTLFRDFAEDNRLSMDIYADCLGQALRAGFPERCRVVEYRPSLLPWPRLLPGSQGLLRMRLSRFVAYPWQASRHQGQVNHIVDHGYGHLLYVLDPRRTVVTVHDLIPLLHWRGQIPGAPAGHKPWLNLIAVNALRRARHLVAVTENTRRDLIHHCGCAPERITVIHSGIDSIFRPYSAEEKEAARIKWNLPADDTKRIMVTGSQFYKNHTGALHVLARLRELHGGRLQLIKTGPPTSEWTRTAQDLGIQTTTACLGILPRAGLSELYNIVDCLLFPSLYEGFGWPPLEAMACGTPVVTSNVASLPEVVGDAALMVDPQDHEGLAQVMYEVLTNDELRNSLIERGLARARQFTWEKAARETLAVYERVVCELDPIALAQR